MPAKVAPPPLARFNPLNQYKPQYGDFVIKFGWISIKFGVVCAYDQSSDIITMILEGHPRVLFTLQESEQDSKTESMPFSAMRNQNMSGKWVVLQHDQKSHSLIWYI